MVPLLSAAHVRPRDAPDSPDSPDDQVPPPRLRRGAHAHPDEGMCVMEYVSLVSGHGFSDRPPCTHPALAALARGVNDRVSDRARPGLVRLAPALRGTNTPCPHAGPAVVSACVGKGLEFAPDDRRLRRLLASAGQLDGDGPCGGDERGGLLAWHGRRRAAYRTEMAVFEGLGRVAAVLGEATPAARDRRDAELVALLVDVVAAHRRHTDLTPVEVDLPGLRVPEPVA